MIQNAAICTVASKNQLGYVRTLFKSCLEINPGIKFYLLLMDEAENFFNPDNELFSVVQLSELDNVANSPSLFFEYDPKELKDAFKPYFFECLFKNFHIQKLIYFDPEVLVLDNLSRIWNLLEKSSLVLIPSPIRAVERNIHLSEIDILNAGAFRQGFIGMSNASTTLSFLADQQKHLFGFCTSDPKRFSDIRPRKLESLSWILDVISLLDHPIYYASYYAHRWLTLSLVTKEGKIIAGNQPVTFFNFCGIDLGMRFNDEKRQVMNCLFDHYQYLLHLSGQQEAEKWPNTYVFFDNGIRIPDLARKLYSKCKDQGIVFENPFLTKGEDNFFHWLNEPVNGSSERIFSGYTTRLMWKIYESRSDLRETFPDPFGKDEVTLLAWFERYGLKEYQLDKVFLPRFRGQSFLESLMFFMNELKKFFLWQMSYSIPRFFQRTQVRTIGHIYGFFRTVFRQVFFFRKENKLQIGVNKAGKCNLSFGVNIVGLIRGPLGIGEAARCSIRALQAVDIPYVINNIDMHFHRNMDSNFRRFSKRNPYRVNLIHLNAPEMKEIIRQKGEGYLKNRYNIGFWFWELSSFPEEWLPFFQYYDEIWVASHFCLESVSKVSPIPVTKITLPVFMPGSVEKRRFRFLLEEDIFVFLFIFDFKSYFERKNPMAIVEAFSKAFDHRDKVLLVIKSINSGCYPQKMADLKKVAQGKKIRLIEDCLGSLDLLNLVACCDVYVSLHRSEGFGMGMAQAMCLGKPVIATGYSGNMEYMNSNNSFLVKYDLVELNEDYGPYKRGNVWANPDTDHAAQLMREVYNQKSVAEMRAKQALQDIQKFMSPKVTGEKMKSRLLSIVGDSQ